MGKKADIYVRVSTPKQEESRKEHMRILEEYCMRNGYEINRIYMETISGSKDARSRPMFREMMKDVESGKIDAVLTLKLDRFSRSLLDLLDAIETFRKHNVGFICVDDPLINTTTPQGTLILQIMGALAEFERVLIYERTKVGIERAKREGKVCHRPRKNINLDRVLDRYNKGIPLTEIAAIEHVSYSTLRNRLREAGITLEKKLEETR
ncbi:MAG: recombinase family protein [Euryarchaeota archaeon]|nr:recombinase family protein [Euryarchaeota archaeon]